MSRAARIRLAAAALAIVSLMLAACSSPSSNAKPQRHNQQPDSATARQRTALRADAARTERGLHVRGEITGTWGILTSPLSSLGTPITTDGGIAVGPGHYVLTFACLGTGRVEAELRIGKASTRTRVICQARSEPIRLRLLVHQGGHEFVQFMATRKETVTYASKLGSPSW